MINLWFLFDINQFVIITLIIFEKLLAIFLTFDLNNHIQCGFPDKNNLLDYVPQY